MTAITRAQMETLLNLQEIEIQRHDVEKILDAVAEKIAGLDRELSEFSRSIDKERSALADLNARHGEFEEQVRVNTALIGKIEEKRRSVKTNREYQSLIKEEEQLRARKSQIEDEMLECMAEIENLSQKINEQEEEFRQIDEQVASDKQAVAQEASDSESRLQALATEVQAVEADLSPELLQAFSRVKKMSDDGKALAPVRNSICMGCHMNIPPQMYNELQRFDRLKLCPFCNRILYWDNPDTEG
jgi:predicted  nucleic acid-binding Zn-ribbon protein